MNKFLKILGGIFLVLLIVVGIAAAIFIPRAMSLNADAMKYISTNVPPIVQSWNSDELVKRAAPELITPEARKAIPGLFVWFSSLGKLKKLDKPVGRIYTGAHLGTHTYGTWGEYAVHADFDGGPAQITIVLIRDGASWKIMGFHVNSPVLLPPHK